MARLVLPEDRVHPAIRARVASRNRDLVEEVDAATRGHAVVVVGMALNPHCGRARRALAAKGIPFHYLEYGGYLSQWRRRNALKMWCGWPSFPMVFVEGALVGGASDLVALLDAGELDHLAG